MQQEITKIIRIDHTGWICANPEEYSELTCMAENLLEGRQCKQCQRPRVEGARAVDDNNKQIGELYEVLKGEELWLYYEPYMFQAHLDLVE